MTNKRATTCWYCKKRGYITKIPKGEGIAVRVLVNHIGNGDRFACKKCMGKEQSENTKKADIEHKVQQHRNRGEWKDE